MSHRLGWLCQIAFVFGATPAVAHCDQVPKREGVPSVNEVEAIVGARTPLQARDAYRQLLEGNGTRVLRLKTSSATGVALRAAWEEVRLSVSPDQQELDASLNAHRLHRFIGFVEARVGGPLPVWWEEAVQSARAYERSNIFFAFSANRLLPNEASGFRMPANTTLKKCPNGVHISIAGESTPIPTGDLESGRKRPGASLSGVVRGDKAYVAIFSDNCNPYQLICIDRKQGATVWRSEVWASAAAVAYFGRTCHYSSVAADESRVLVFGAGPDCVYLEAFDASTGAVLFRFSTSY
jgi:hypothetical protein